MNKAPQLVLCWNPETRRFSLGPLDELMEAMQDAFIRGATTGPPCFILATVQDRKDAMALAGKLVHYRDLNEALKEQLVTATA
jgi:hypothetical protein